MVFECKLCVFDKYYLNKKKNSIVELILLRCSANTDFIKRKNVVFLNEIF